MLGLIGLTTGLHFCCHGHGGVFPTGFPLVQAYADVVQCPPNVARSFCGAAKMAGLRLPVLLLAAPRGVGWIE